MKKEKKKEKKYEGWLVSNNFNKRAIACWAHAMIGYLIIIGIVIVIFSIVSFISWVFTL